MPFQKIPPCHEDVMIRKVAAVLLLCYSLTFAGYYIYTTTHVDATRRDFTAKELSDGPLVLKDTVSLGKRFVAKNTGKVVPAPVDDSPIPVLSAQFLENFLVLAKRIRDSGEPFVYFSFLNPAFEKLTLNWLCNVADFNNTHSRILIAGTTESVCFEIHKRWPNISCISLDLKSLDASSEWGSKSYIRLLTLRAELLLSLVKADVQFVLFETDAVWLRDPFYLFLNQTVIDDADIVVPVKGYNNKWDGLAFSPMVVYATDGAKQLFRRMVEMLKADEKAYDQDVLNELCNAQYNGAVCRQFEWEDVADGKWFKLSDRERQLFEPYIVNNNYYVGVQNKESRQALNGLWFLTTQKGCARSKVQRGLGKWNGSETGHNV